MSDQFKSGHGTDGAACGTREPGGRTMSLAEGGGSIVDETVFYAEQLTAREFRGLGDTIEAARFRLARRTGVTESYLKRLRHRAHEMKDVAGSVYRSLRDAYEAAVEEEARRAHAARNARRAIEHGEVDAQPALALVGGAAARPRKGAGRPAGRR